MSSVSLTPAATDLSAYQTKALSDAAYLSAQAVEELSGTIKSAQDGTYILSPSIKFALDIVNITLKTSAGTVTVALNRDATPITDCGAISATGTAGTTVAGAAAKRVAAGESLSLVLSAASSLGDLSYAIKATRV